LPICNSSSSNIDIDCKIFGDGGRGQNHVVKKSGLLWRYFWLFSLQKAVLKKKGSHSKKNNWQEQIGWTPYLYAYVPH
jgi:hypothetical protein